jgi:hypothetical protein
MNAIWEDLSDHEAYQSQEINFALIVMVEDLSNGIDVETIIATKNITDPITIEILHKIAETKKPKTQPINLMCSQAIIPTSLKQSPLSSHQEVIKVASSTPLMEDL